VRFYFYKASIGGKNTCSYPRIMKRKIHKNTKYWSFTCGTTVMQKKLPNEVKLKKFLNNITEICVFQLECGSVKNNY